jgi:type IV pilus assembly protein PilW
MNIKNMIISKKNSGQAGFTLIEILVGLVIGLIATLVIVQTFTAFEGRKRVTTGAADAQTSGSIALYNIEREVQSAGYGIPILDGDLKDALGANGNNSVLHCNDTTKPADPALKVDHDNDVATAAIDLFPIQIINGNGYNDSDTIVIRTGTTDNGGVSTNISAPVNHGANTVPVGSNLGCTPNSIVLFIDGGQCKTSRVATSGNVADDFTNLAANPLAIVLTDTNNINQSATARISCIGQFYNETQFGISNKNELMRADRNNPPPANGTAGGVPVLSDIVNLQAQYGLATSNGSNQVTKWVDTVTFANRNSIRAIRVAIVARNSKREDNVVPTSTGCSSLVDANPTGLCSWDATSANPTTASPAPNINLIANDANWNHYRYRVYETIIPIRNMIFAGTILK